MNLTYLNVTLTGKVLRWKLYLQDKDFHLCHVPGKEVHQQIPDAFSRLCENNMPSKHVNPVGKLSSLQLEVGSLPYSNSSAEQLLPPQPGVAQPAVVQPKNRIAKPIYKKIAKVHNSMEGHWGLDICKRHLNRIIRELIRQCPSCQAMSQLRIPIITRCFTCASYYPFEVTHLDHIGPLPANECSPLRQPMRSNRHSV